MINFKIISHRNIVILINIVILYSPSHQFTEQILLHNIPWLSVGPYCIVIFWVPTKFHIMSKITGDISMEYPAGR